MKKIFKVMFVVLVFLTITNQASAHVKWFVDSGKVMAESHNTSLIYDVTSLEVVMWSIITLLAVIVFGIFDKYIPAPRKLVEFGEKHEKSIVYAAQIILGLYLITTGIIWKIILIPEIPVNDTLRTILQVIQVVIGTMYIIKLSPRTASAVLLGLCIYMMSVVGVIVLVENTILVSLAIYFFIRNSPSNSYWSRFDKYSTEIVRIGTAISLIVFAFTEKLMYPELAMSFLSIHHWNFMQPIFPWFTDRLFVLSTGFAELIFGIVYILGYLTRINTALITMFFATSVVTMALQFHQWEVEDLVVYSAAIIFIFYGHGKTKFFHAYSPGTWLQKNLLSK